MIDRKSLIILLVSATVFAGAWFGIDHLYPPVPRPAMPRPSTNAVAMRSNAPSEAGSNAIETTWTANGPVAMATPAGPEQTLQISNQCLVLHFTSHGGGIKLVELQKYPDAVKRMPGKPAPTNRATMNARALAPVMAVLGGAQLEGDNSYVLSQTDHTVRAEKTLSSGLRVVKEFQILTNYQVTAKIRLENTSATPIALPAQRVVIGTANAIGLNEDPLVVGVYWYNGTKLEDLKDAWFVNSSLGGCVPGSPRSEYQGGASDVVWAAVHSQFFTLATIPATNAPKIIVDKIQLPRASLNDTSAMTNGFQAALAYPETALDAGKSIERSYTLYAGPKEYDRLAQIGQKLNNNLDLIMGFGGFFGFFSKLLLLSMNGLHAIGIKYALAIIFITIIIKMLFWPLTNASTKSMKRMQELQPQLKAIADKYKDDPNKKNQKTMEFMKEHKVNPLGGCLPMLLQIPVFIGFYYMLRSAIELRGESFLWAVDLSQPDTVAYISGVPLNILPLLMGITMIWQSGLTPASPGMDPSQQKIMRWGLPVMMLFFFYNMSAGLTLYWTVQNILTIVQTKLTKTTNPSGPGAKAGLVALLKKKK